MFRTTIRSTPLVSNEANDALGNIKGQYFGDDVTFLSTLRALVAPRMGKDDKIILSFRNSSYPNDYIRDHGGMTMIRTICENVGRGSGRGRIIIHSFVRDNKTDNDAYFELIKTSFEQCYEGWHRLNKVTDFFRKDFKVLCFINPDEKNVYLFTEKMNNSKMHYLQCSILAFLPWYFDSSVGVSELEMELINSLREKRPNKYEECIEKIASQYDFRAQRIRNLLTGFETRYERRQYDQVKDEIQGYINDLNRINHRFGEVLQNKSEAEIILMGLEAKIASNNPDESEIMEYFLCNKRLVIEHVTDEYMEFSCADYLTYFDEEIARQMIDNERSYVYRPNGVYRDDIIKQDDMKKLMYAIFVEQTLKLKMCCAYHFELNGSVRGLAGYNYGYEFKECTPNPHIDRYACMGDYSRTINELLRDRNYIGAIEQCIASCKSLNFADSPVMEEFMCRIYGISDQQVNICCIELPDGKVVAPKEAVKWLNAHEQETEQTEEGAGSNE